MAQQDSADGEMVLRIPGEAVHFVDHEGLNGLMLPAEVQCGEKAEIVKILNNGNAAGFPVLRSEPTPTKEFNPRAFTVFGPKIIATRQDFDDRALESRCITEVMSGLPPRSDIPLSVPKSFHQEATELRNKLLGYRFQTLGKHRDATMPRESGIEARVAQVFSSLLAIVTDNGARERILALARKQSGTIREDRNASIEAMLLAIILDMRRESCPLGVRAIAERFAERHQADFARSILGDVLSIPLLYVVNFLRAC